MEDQFTLTTGVKKIQQLTKRIRAIQGGTSASKTIGILLTQIDLAQRDSHPTLTSVISESFPHLKKGAMRDFLTIMEKHNYYKADNWNKTDFIYTFETGSKIEFFSADQDGKVRGPRRNRLFINEANNIPHIIFDQLEVRTMDVVWMDWNPSSEFWFYTEVLHQRDDIDHIILTYKDNEALSDNIVKSIETRKNRKGWWKVYGRGELGEVEGKIYRDWDIIADIPRYARLERYGLDFGYSVDPTSIVGIYYYQGGYILDELMYLKGMSNKRIADFILDQDYPHVMVVADSAEPKSIDEIKGHGVNILGAEKGRDSVNTGIQLVQDQQISMTRNSVNLIREYRNYLWAHNRAGEIIGMATEGKPSTPEHRFSHTMDAVRYGLVSLLKRKEFKITPTTPLKPYYPELGL